MAIPQIGSFQLQNDSSRLKSLRDIFEDSRRKKKKKNRLVQLHNVLPQSHHTHRMKGSGNKINLKNGTSVD